MKRRFNKTFRAKAVVALLAATLYYVITKALAKKRRNNTRILVAGSGNGLYENNVAVMVDYIKSECPELYKIYFVTEHSLTIPGVKLIRIGSYRSYLVALRADVIMFDTCNSDVAPGIQRRLAGLKVNVNHGFEGLKMLPRDYFNYVSADIHCSASKFEADIKISKMGCPKESVYVTGYPRFDRLHHDLDSKSFEESNNILCFFTWRDWNVNIHTDINEYISVYDAIMTSEISDLLGSRVMYVKPHMKISTLITSQFNNIVVLSEDENLTEIIAQCGSLITDYSSVTWDFLYNGRPVFFFCYDYSRYSKDQGLFIDYEASFGSNFTGDTLSCNRLKKFIKSPKLNFDASKYFDWKDGRSCQRLLASIEKYDK